MEVVVVVMVVVVVVVVAVVVVVMVVVVVAVVMLVVVMVLVVIAVVVVAVVETAAAFVTVVICLNKTQGQSFWLYRSNFVKYLAYRGQVFPSHTRQVPTETTVLLIQCPKKMCRKVKLIDNLFWSAMPC